MHIAIALLLTIAIIGCQKDSIEFTPSENQSQFVTADIFGVVMDENNDPVQNASISYRGSQVMSDQYGVYTLNGVEIDSKHNVLNISKDGYHLHSRTFRSKSGKTIQLRSKMVALQFEQSFQSNTGGNMIIDGASVKFKPNSIVLEDSEAPYQGEVKVAMLHISSELENIAEILPGDLSTINTKNEIQSQAFYGAVSIVLQSPDGQHLQIKEGNTATLKINTPNGSIASTTNAGSFNHDLGLWQEESIGTVNGGVVTVEVSHFTWWYISDIVPGIILDGRVVDQNGNGIPDKYVGVYNENGHIAAYGTLESDGTFSGLVPVDQNLTFVVYDHGGGCDFPQNIFSEDIGPYSQDTQLGDIVLVLDETTLCSVSGTAVDCDNNVITDGFVKLGNSIFPLTDGTFDASILVCDNDPIAFFATDRVSQQSSNLVMVDAPGDTNLSTISVCGNQADFISINCTDLNMSLNLNDNLQLFYDDTPSDYNYFGLGGNTIENDFRYDFFMLYHVPTATTYEEGEYLIGPGGSPVSEYVFAVSDNTTNFFINEYKLESGSVTITSGGGVGDVIKGTYTYNGRDSISGILYNFYGSFQILF